MSRRASNLAVGLAASLILLALGSSAADAAPAVVVQVGGDDGAVAHDMFWPDTVVVNEGDTVQWQSVAEDTPHTITALPAGGPPLFDSSPNVTQAALGPLFGPGGVLAREGPTGVTVGAEFSHTFDTPGLFTIRCKVHPEMVQTVVVGNDTVQKEDVLAIAGAGGAHASTDFFAPSTLNLSKGQKVTWTVLGPEIHTVTGYAGDHKEFPVLIPPAFDSSPAITPDVEQKVGAFFTDPLGFFSPHAMFNFTFSKAGTYPYFCKLHAGMKGAVIVLPQRAGPTGPTGPTGPAGAKGTPGLAVLGVVGAGVAAAFLARRRRG